MSDLVADLLDFLRSHWLVRDVRIASLDETPYGQLELKVRCRLNRGHQFQVWLHIEPDGQHYAYQLFTDRPLLRWDNAPHYPNIRTAPDHFHDEHGSVTESPLSGDVIVDLRHVLTEVAAWLNQTQ